MMTIKRLFSGAATVLLAAAALPILAQEAKTDAAPALAKSRLMVILPDSCNTPDGMCLLPDGSVIVSIPNFNDAKAPPLLMKIAPDNQASAFFNFPTPYPDTPAGADRIGPMGIACDRASGNLYLADNQGKDQLSRLWKLVLKDGKVDRMVLVARGFNIANGVAVHGGYVYVTESVLVQESRPLVSAVLRFKLNEENVQLTTPLEKDPHIVTTFKSQKDQWRFGADGITFDGKGNLYIGLFGEAVLHKITFDAEGAMASCEKFAEAPGRMMSCDGMSYDPRTDKIYLADCAGNAVHIVHLDGRIETLARNGDVPDKGAKLSGLLDEPSEALVRGNEIVVANMDWPLDGFVNKPPYRMPATLSVIKLK
jgi:sugar lactone lactonase YvrE